MIYKVIRYLLENDSDFSTAVGTDSESQVKVYPLFAPQGVNLPYCTYELNNISPNPAKEETSGLDINSVIVRVWDDNFDTVIDLATKARAAMDKATKGTYNSVSLESIDFDGMNDGSNFNPAEPMYYIELHFECWTR